jgi:SAM-dependent methyltransferase
LQDFDARYYYTDLAASFCRGRLGLGVGTTDQDAIRAGVTAGLKLFKFKRNTELPRVRHVLGVIRGMAPQSLLDVGSGRGTFLWPLLDELPDLAVTAIDVNPQRAEDLAAVSRGGVTRLHALRGDAMDLHLADASIDGVTMLEVLEHMPEPDRALREAVRVARRFIVLTVPSRADDNPEHLHLLTRDKIRDMFGGNQRARVRFHEVRSHLIAVATL